MHQALRRWVAAFAMACLGGTVIAADGETSWPTKPIRIVVGFPPGNSTDISARLIAGELEKTLGQPFVVENRPGAGGTLAIDSVARSGKEGEVILFTSTGPFAIGPHIYKDMKSKPTKDFQPVALVGRAPLLLVVAADSPYKTLSDLVKAGKDPKNTLNYASTGNGATNHLAMELFKSQTDTHFMHVPYKGSGLALTDLIGGRVQVMFDSPAPLLPLIRDGKLRVLATGGAEPYGETPAAPTIAQTYPGFEAGTWTLFAVPAGTPKAIVNKLNAAIMPILGNAELAGKSMAGGVELFEAHTVEQARERYEHDLERWGNAVEKAQLVIN
ncbi:tripartite tricarboxylate transporter substrate binding protein [Bordetella sp. 15P40C-2]|uniref:Bug family tripartite tricarboxylate transporter substrate binding protein n=1 Tax=Bordetella sp. 15P40C-2 TaxID=2572246 RepID=UPI001325EF09|nr:tripartite tricarboxylate transporter substrate binding protein [Bordetella sp. 15P40C-2]MVW72700.1 tripartite tricarboxylate transporter substrate binding protein [Bordetella sp. 15P40C-2]